jgi:hypothetical protein
MITKMSFRPAVGVTQSGKTIAQITAVYKYMTLALAALCLQAF